MSATGTIINITSFSGPNGLESNIEPTWAAANDAATLPGQSSQPAGTGDEAFSNITGRSSQLHAMFPASVLGLTDYDPKTTFVSMMNGTDSGLALGATKSDGAGQYFGNSVTNSHLTYGAAPDLSQVNITTLNIPNPYVPDISNGAATAADYKTEFESKYPGTRNSFPPIGLKADGTVGEIETQLDLNAGGATPGINPSTTSTRTGGWFTDTTLNWGRWSAE